MVTDSLSPFQTKALSRRLQERAARIQSWLCVGLDPDPDQMPADIPRSAAGLVEFCERIVVATSPHAVCFKINFGFFESFGVAGWQALAETRQLIPPAIPVIADAKRGDIANTARGYARGIFEELGFDAVTISPYLGWDSIEPFLGYRGRCVLVLTRTSNPGAADLQELRLQGEQLYLHVARRSLQLRGEAEVGLVVGATAPEAVRAVRRLSQDALLLIPGVGAQGATIEVAMAAGASAAGLNALINVSRDILYAANGTEFAAAAAGAAARLAAETWNAIAPAS